MKHEVFMPLWYKWKEIEKEQQKQERDDAILRHPSNYKKQSKENN